MLRARAFRRLVPHCGPGEHCLELVRSQVVDVQVGEVEAARGEDRSLPDLIPVESVDALVEFQGVERNHTSVDPMWRIIQALYIF